MGWTKSSISVCYMESVSVYTQYSINKSNFCLLKNRITLLTQMQAGFTHEVGVWKVPTQHQKGLRVRQKERIRTWKLKRDRGLKAAYKGANPTCWARRDSTGYVEEQHDGGRKEGL